MYLCIHDEAKNQKRKKERMTIEMFNLDDEA